jgi:hypothetical protein
MNVILFNSFRLWLFQMSAEFKTHRGQESVGIVGFAA